MRPAVVIRRARPSDLQQVVAMVGHFIQGTQYQRVLRWVPEAVTELADRILQLGVIFVAENEAERLVGMIAGFAVQEPIGQTRLLDELAWWVEIDYRNGSTGPKLLREWERWAQAEGLEAIRMISPASSPEVGAYYAKRGYFPVETAWLKRL